MLDADVTGLKVFGRQHDRHGLCPQGACVPVAEQMTVSGHKVHERIYGSNKSCKGND